MCALTHEAKFKHYVKTRSKHSGEDVIYGIGGLIRTQDVCTMYIRTYVRMYVYMDAYVRMYVCMDTYIHTSQKRPTNSVKRDLLRMHGYTHTYISKETY